MTLHPLATTSSQETFKTLEQRFREAHGDKYDYSLVEYISTRIKIKIVCHIHGIFEQRSDSHYGGSGCIKCMTNKNKSNTDEFIIKAKEVHGDKYDHSLSKYINAKTKIKIVCYTHGMFEQLPGPHRKGVGCLHCGKNHNRSSTNEFIAKSTNKYGLNRFDYSLVEYKNNSTKVDIICRTHGKITQTPSQHLCKGCSECNFIQRKKLAEIEFTQKANIIHMNQYDYSLINLTTKYSKASIICKTHGMFELEPHMHMRGIGCLLCSYEKRRMPIEEFINKANIIHKGLYSYDFLSYTEYKTKASISCKTHGLFSQTPASHLQGQGCPQCCQTGFDKSKPAILYYVKVLDAYDIYKIGITNRTVKERFRIDKVRVIRSWYYDNGEEAHLQEQKILSEYKQHQYKGDPILKQSGDTEMFYGDILLLDS